jgi:hypothetical protein
MDCTKYPLVIKQAYETLEVFHSTHIPNRFYSVYSYHIDKEHREGKDHHTKEELPPFDVPNLFVMFMRKRKMSTSNG